MENLKKEILEWKKTDNFLKKKAEEERELKKLESFLNEFNIKKIEELTIDEYIVGKGSKESFCYKVEKELKFFGEIGGWTTAYTKFILYWNKKKEYSFGPENWTERKSFGNNTDEIFKNIKKYLLELIDHTINNNYKEIVDIPFIDTFKNKVSFLYSKNQLPIYGKDFINLLLKNLNIKFDENENVVFKREKLWDFYNKYFKSIVTPNLFIDFFWTNKGYEKKLKKSKDNKTNKKEVISTNNESKSMNNNNNFNLNTIFYGAPGTGKTFEAIKLSKEITNYNDKNIKFVTFHQSYEYEDFVEGIKVKTTTGNNIEYYIRDGIFKDLCKTANKNKNEKFVIIIDEINRGNISKIFGGNSKQNVSFLKE